MSGIQGVGGIPEPRPGRPAGNAPVRPRDEADVSQNSSSQDDVEISSEAQAAAAVAKIIQSSQTQGDIRADRVAAAKEAIERGDYRQHDIAQVVAERISKYL
jgi:anti-sigma28 factor (negative regulator of flagellin synthesis)